MKRLAAAIALLLLPAQSFAATADWPQYGYSARGQRNNTEERTLDRHSVKQLARAWSADLATGGSSPAVVNGIVYVNATDGSLHALDAATGAQVWQQHIGLSQTSPAVANGIVYTGSNENNVYAFEAASGAPLWTAPAQAGVTGITVAKGMVYAATDSGVLSAFDAAAGTLKWSATEYRYNLTTPAVAAGIVYSVADMGAIFAYDARKGTLLWQLDWGSAHFAGSPAIDKGLVVYSTDTSIAAFDAKTGTNVWKTGVGPSWSSFAMMGGRLYMGTRDHVLWTFDTRTGGLIDGVLVGVPFDCSAAIAGGVVYLSSDLGTINAYDAKTNKLLWSDAVGGVPNRVAPVVAEGMLFVPANKLTAYAIGGNADRRKH